MTSTNNIKKSKTGRPSVDSEAITLRLHRDTLAILDDWRRHQEDLPNRQEAIRRLTATGIKAEPILRDVMKMLVELRGTGPTHELDQHIEAIMEALGKAP